MTIVEIYTKYQIMPQLSLHMRRVAGVGKLIMEGWKGELDRDVTMKAILLHDMGNLVKFDLTNLMMPVENVEYWKQVQQEWWDKYGRDTHEVTMAVVKELGQDDAVKILHEEHVGYIENDTRLIMKQSWPAKILAYCDVRVTPNGVVPMKIRIADLQARYGRDLSWYNFLYKLEEEIKTMTSTDLGSITESAVQPLLDELLNYRL